MQNTDGLILGLLMSVVSSQFLFLNLWLSLVDTKTNGPKKQGAGSSSLMLFPSAFVSSPWRHIDARFKIQNTAEESEAQ